MNKKIFGLWLCVILVLAGCAETQTMTKGQKGGLIGAAGGALAGAALGQAIGHDTRSTVIGAAIGAAVGGGGGYAVGKMMDKQEQDMRKALENSQAADVSREGNLLSVNFKGDVTFATNSAEVKPSLYAEINRIAGILNQYPETVIRVEGHTDSIGSDDYNMALSKRRAESVKTLLVQRGVAESRIEVVGYGKTMPVASNETEAGRKKNRRVEIKIAPKTQTP